MEEKKLNIGLFIDTFYPMVDGVIMVVDNYARNLSKFANVTVFAPTTKGDFDDSTLPYKVVRSKSMRIPFFDYDLPTPKFGSKFKKAIKDANLDIIHIHSPFGIGKMASSYGKKHNIPVIATMHSQYKQDFYKATHNNLITKMLLKSIVKVFNKCDVLWTMNHACVKVAREYGVKIPIDIITNATNLVNNYTANEIEGFKKEIRAKYNIKNDEKMLLSIGRINKLKNIDLTLSSCKVLTDKNFKYKLLIIGDGSDMGYFVSKTHKLGIENNCVFVGKVVDTNEKCKYFASADLHVFPSFYDTDGIVRIEAAAFNLPTLFAEGSVAGSAIIKDVNGFSAKAEPIPFADEIIKIFSNDQLYERVRENCYKDIYITFDRLAKIVYEKYINLINNTKTN